MFNFLKKGNNTQDDKLKKSKELISEIQLLINELNDSKTNPTDQITNLNNFLKKFKNDNLMLCFVTKTPSKTNKFFRTMVDRLTDISQAWEKYNNSLQAGSGTQKLKPLKETLTEALNTFAKHMKTFSAAQKAWGFKKSTIATGGKDISVVMTCLSETLSKTVNASLSRPTVDIVSATHADAVIPVTTADANRLDITSDTRKRFIKEMIEKHYKKNLREDIVLYYRGKKYIWEHPVKDTKRYADLPLLPDLDRLSLIFEGARGRDLTNLRTTFDASITLPHGTFRSDADRLTAAKALPPTTLRQLVSSISNLYVSPYRRAGDSMANREHGTKHARQVVRFVPEIAAFIQTHQNDFHLTVSDKEITLAQFAALFHDSGRKAHMVDIFDETSAHRASKYLGKSFPNLQKSDIDRVSKAILDKDKNVSGKDVVTILLHEADCLDIMRLHGVKGFNPKYLDLYQLYLKYNPNVAQPDCMTSWNPTAQVLCDLKEFISSWPKLHWPVK